MSQAGDISPAVLTDNVDQAASTPTTSTPTTRRTAGRERDRYLDALRFLAIGRIIVYHVVGFAWLTYFYPSIGVMFALAGSLMANSLARPGNGAVRNRLRRLLPALWVFGAVVVPLMIDHEVRQGDVWDLPSPGWLLAWVFPVVDPPGTEWTLPATVVLWYLVTYLWFVLLSPLALRAYRRWPLPTVVLPLVALAIVQIAGFELESVVGTVVLNLAMFGSCWLVGFAHRDGRLQRVRLPLLVGVAAAAMLAGAIWAFTHLGDSGLDLNEIPLAQGLYSFGFVLLALRLRPGMGWLRRASALNWMVTAVNARAVTIYLWHNPAISVSYPIGDRLDVWRFGEGTGNVLCAAIALALTAAATVAVGWVEDIAARRRPQLLPR